MISRVTNTIASQTIHDQSSRIDALERELARVGGAVLYTDDDYRALAKQYSALRARTLAVIEPFAELFAGKCVRDECVSARVVQVGSERLMPKREYSLLVKSGHRIAISAGEIRAAHALADELKGDE